jgi:hypothetical protein
MPVARCGATAAAIGIILFFCMLDRRPAILEVYWRD